MPRVKKQPNHSLGQALRYARTRAALTRREVEQRAGLRRGKLSDYEQSRHIPTLDLMVRIGEGIGVDAWRILRAASRLAARKVA